MPSEAGGCSLWLACRIAPATSRRREMCLSRVVSALFVAPVCGGVDTQTTPSPFGPVVWLLNWSDRLEGRSRHNRSHYAALCTLTLGVCVCLQFSGCNQWMHVTHALCVFCVVCAFWFCCCANLLLAVFAAYWRINCTVHTRGQSGLRGRSIQVVYTLISPSNPLQHFILLDHLCEISTDLLYGVFCHNVMLLVILGFSLKDQIEWGQLPPMLAKWHH